MNINWEQLNLDPQLLWADYILPWGTQIVLAILVFFIGRIIARTVTNGTRKVMEKASLEPMLVNFLANIIGSVLLLLVIVFSLSQLGVDTTSLVALLGAAGLAVGLALKDSLSHFAAGVMLILFRPFKVGDFCELDGEMGTVEQITILHTRLKTPDNKVITIPNGNVFSGTMTNFSEQPTRRVGPSSQLQAASHAHQGSHAVDPTSMSTALNAAAASSPMSGFRLGICSGLLWMRKWR